MTAILQFDATGMGLLRVRAEEGSIHVLHYAAQQGAWHDAEELKEALRAFIAQHIQPGDAIYSILPRYEITTRLLDLPSQDDVEIDGMLHLSAEEHVPYGAEELLIRHARLHATGQGESMVFAVFARAQVVDQHVALLQELGLEPEQILLSTACLLSAVAATAPETPERFAMAHAATAGLEVAVFDQRQAVYIRGVSMPHGWPELADGAPEELVAELRASLSAYRRESIDGMGTEQVYASSDWANPVDLSSGIEMETGKDCAPADFLRKAVRNADALGGALPAVLLGGALSAAGKARHPVNLLPEHVRQARQASGVRTQALRLAVLAALVCILAGALFFQRVWQYQGYIRELEAQVESLAPQAEGVAEKQAQLNIIARQVDRQGGVLDLLGASVASLPEKDINITKVSYERATGLELWGRAMAVEDVASFASTLRAAGKGALSLLQSAHRIYEQQDVERETTPIWLFHVGALVAEEGEGGALDEATP